jgi:hypothetical protein
MPVIEDVLWKNPGNPGMIVISGHASVQEDGSLFMGYGDAQEAIKRIPGIELQCAREVLSHAVDGVYGFLPVRPPRPDQRIIGFGLFQTRIHWNDNVDPDLIRYSMDCLRSYTQQNSDLKIRMNFPGTRQGGLPADQVAPLLIPLPPTVTVCHQGEITTSLPNSFPGFKSIYLEVERMLQEGQYNRAVEYLMNSGFDIQSAMNQVNAVQRCLKERNEGSARRVDSWRQSQF